MADFLSDILPIWYHLLSKPQKVHTPKGRVDMVLRTATHLYLFELKLNKSANMAMKQIDLKDYAKRFALCGLPIVKVGINFDVETHNITDWKVEEG